jgi:hypothetical protein
MPLSVVSCSSIRFTTRRSYTGIVEDHLPYLIADPLPVVNEVARLYLAHNFSALVFEHGDDRFRILALMVLLSMGDGPE